MFWAEEAVIWVAAALALIGYVVLLWALLVGGVREWRVLRNVGISARAGETRDPAGVAGGPAGRAGRSGVHAGPAGIGSPRTHRRAA